MYQKCKLYAQRQLYSLLRTKLIQLLIIVSRTKCNELKEKLLSLQFV